MGKKYSEMTEEEKEKQREYYRKCVNSIENESSDCKQVDFYDHFQKVHEQFAPRWGCPKRR